MIYRLIWTDSKGASRQESSRYIGRFWKKLETIRCNAELWWVDDAGALIEVIGGCERANAPDDKRIKWHWWYDKSYGGPDITLEQLITA